MPEVLIEEGLSAGQARTPTRTMRGAVQSAGQARNADEDDELARAPFECPVRGVPELVRPVRTPGRETMAGEAMRCRHRSDRWFGLRPQQAQFDPIMGATR